MDDHLTRGPDADPDAQLASAAAFRQFAAAADEVPDREWPA
jgi:hypothetical protein